MLVTRSAGMDTYHSLAQYVVCLMHMRKLQNIIIVIIFILWPSAAWKGFRARWGFVFRVYFSSACSVRINLLGRLRQPLMTTYVAVPNLAVVTFLFFLLSLSIIWTTTPAVRFIYLTCLLVYSMLMSVVRPTLRIFQCDRCCNRANKFAFLFI